jgi:ribosome-binding protein aMBF1 (putative translation factor)
VLTKKRKKQRIPRLFRANVQHRKTTTFDFEFFGAKSMLEEKTDLSSFGKRLSHAIKSSPYSRKHIADSVGIRLAILTEYETDRAMPSFFEIEMFSDILATPINWLTKGKHPGIPRLD